MTAISLTARTQTPGTSGFRAAMVQPTVRWGWLAVSGVSVLLVGTGILENVAFPTGRVNAQLALSLAMTVAAVMVSYPFPLVGLLVSIVFTVASVFVPGMPHHGGTGLITAMVLVGFLAFRLPGRWSLLAWLVAALTPGVTQLVVAGDAFEILFYLLFLAPAWAVGTLMQRERRRSAQLARMAADLATEREHRTQTAVLAERTRISRELHDAVAHSVSVMTLQVGVVRRRMPPGSVEHETLTQAEHLGRQSVDELRQIVGMIRPAGPELAPVPSLRHLDDLVAQVRLAGTEVRLRADDPPELTPALDVCAYRIVQEALTNALKHAPGTAIEVDLHRDAAALVITVRDHGRTAPAQVVRGNGLTGMAERVAVFDGTLEHACTPSGGFVVTATLPIASVSRDEPAVVG